MSDWCWRARRPPPSPTAGSWSCGPGSSFISRRSLTTVGWWETSRTSPCTSWAPTTTRGPHDLERDAGGTGRRRPAAGAGGTAAPLRSVRRQLGCGHHLSPAGWHAARRRGRVALRLGAGGTRDSGRLDRCPAGAAGQAGARARRLWHDAPLLRPRARRLALDLDRALQGVCHAVRRPTYRHRDRVGRLICTGADDPLDLLGDYPEHL